MMIWTFWVDVILKTIIISSIIIKTPYIIAWLLIFKTLLFKALQSWVLPCSTSIWRSLWLIILLILNVKNLVDVVNATFLNNLNTIKNCIVSIKYDFPVQQTPEAKLCIGTLLLSLLFTISETALVSIHILY